MLNDRVDQLSERVDHELTTVGQGIDGAAAAHGYDTGLAHQPPSSHPYAVDGASNREGEADLPPRYSRANNGPSLPPGTVDAAPGQTQAAVDEARAAARRPIQPALAQGQASTTTPNGQGQTVHSYYGAGGCAKVEYVAPFPPFLTFYSKSRD